MRLKFQYLHDCIIQLLEQIYLKHDYTCNGRVQVVNERSRPMAVVIVRTLRMTYDRFKLDERAVHHGAAVGPKVLLYESHDARYRQIIPAGAFEYFGRTNLKEALKSEKNELPSLSLQGCFFDIPCPTRQFVSA